MRGSKTFALLALLFILFTNMGYSAMAESQVSIADIRKEVMTGWHQTYEVNGSTILVDVDIEVPNVEFVPAIYVTLPHANIEPKLRNMDASEIVIAADGFGYTMPAPYHSIFPFDSDSDSQILFEENNRAENSPLSQAEAAEFYINLTKEFESEFGPQDPEVRYLMTYSRKYKILSRGTVNELDVRNPLSETGYYLVQMYQRFHGIPYLQSTPPIIVPSVGKQYTAPMGSSGGYIASENDYSFSMYPAVETGILADDLPLASFSQAKQEFEKRIKAGYIREVHSVRFGYLAYYDPNDLGNSFILLPIWELRGVIVDEPKHPTPSVPAGMEEYYRTFSGMVALVNAQTGILIDPKDGKATSRYANAITWELAK